MSCEELREWLSAELDGEAKLAEREAVRRHLETCPACRRAHAAAAALRTGLTQAAYRWPDAEARDEQVLATLRREGRCHPPRFSSSLPGAVLEFFCRVPAAPSLRPALAAMSVAFLLTWTALRWAETPALPVPSSAAAGAMALDGTPGKTVRPLDTALLDQWLAGSPTLSALSRIRRVTSPDRERPVAPRRGAAGGVLGHMG